jgi:hypothetical protein
LEVEFWKDDWPVHAVKPAQSTRTQRNIRFIFCISEMVRDHWN